ncbi:MAG: hypothetical protein ISR90_06575 [Candidatus Marinimicrobia bacterium]|nr:hypothetical protein [Candidatus Neomarinimicrobiota bacterium]MBL7023696.1 hypothetical protein [Candidatus Neomarinimicrobiota bacterium]MBL7110002.1 hypothetical protein [Candidatus Neomarinimicrobiota bacterium]
MKYLKSIKTSTFLVVFTFVIIGCNPGVVTLEEVVKTELDKDAKIVGKYQCSVGAHRGDSQKYTENTIEAIRSATNDNQFTFLEFDVQFTKDKKVVAYHDKTLFRLYGNLNKITSLTLLELKEITENNIALYNEIINIVCNKKVNIEIKSSGNKETDNNLVDFIINDIDLRKIRNNVMISSISTDVIKYVNNKYPNIKTGQIFWIGASTYIPFDFLTENLYDKVLETGADYIMLHVSNLHNIEDLMKLKPKNKTVVFWNLDNKMYLVHRDPSDVIWGNSIFIQSFKYYWHYAKYLILHEIF